MAKTIFRKIGGKVIPIKIASVKLSSDRRGRAILAKTPSGEIVGRVLARFGRKSVDFQDIHVHAPFRKKGIASALFDHLEKISGRSGRKFIRSNGIVSEAQVKIRSKRKTKFIFDDLMNLGKPKIVSSEKAIKLIKVNKNEGLGNNLIVASTMIRKTK